MRAFAAILLCAYASTASAMLRAAAAGDLRAMVSINRATQAGVGELLGEITVVDSNRGLLLQPSLMHLPPGDYGFFVHAHASCEPSVEDGVRIAAGKSGAVLRRRVAVSHMQVVDAADQPEDSLSNGRVGNLPRIHVGFDQTFSTPLVAPRLRMADLIGHSLVITTIPKNENARRMILACGVVPHAAAGDSTLARSMQAL